eukprot:TRINITY_DN36502_c0_g1_i1.p1 TRINITY_DN36502_c0_g1~~TRINITY_DN36502_c0_g1_i1.p1  ORF type:complete len:580 (-),score=134.66 TRINITY_DN36502_c0_g1_i1:144-1883(-)
MGAACCSEREHEDDGKAPPPPRPRQPPLADKQQQDGGVRVLGPGSRGAGRRLVFSQSGQLLDFYEPASAGKANDGASLDDAAALGEGSFGQVRLVRDKRSLDLRALKVVHKQEPDGQRRDIDELMQELETMAATDHPHVAKLYHGFQDDEAMYLVVEYCSGGDLFAHLTEGTNYLWHRGCGYKAFGEKRVADILQQVCRAAAHIHANGLVHCDLKPHNFVFENSTPEALLKLIDFGMAKFSASESQRLLLGTPDYAAPEMLRAQSEPETVVSFPGDVWAIGVMLHLMLTGTMPRSANRRILFVDQDDFVEMQLEVLESGPTYDFDAPEWRHISEDAKHLLAGMLQLEPSRRPTASSALRHVWIVERAPRAAQQTLDEAIVGRLAVFARRSKLQQAALSIAADRMRVGSEARHLQQVWDSLDTDGDGLVSLHVLEEHMAKCGIKPPPGLSAALAALTGPGGRVGANQFLAATLEPRKLRERGFARMVFHALDMEGRGRIFPQQLKAAVGDDCGVGPNGVDEKQFYALLDKSAMQWEPVLGGHGRAMPSAPLLTPAMLPPRTTMAQTAMPLRTAPNLSVRD